MIKAILEDFKSIKSSKKELREFGFTMAVVLGLIALYVCFKKKEPAWVYFACAGAFFLFWALVYPGLLRPLQKVWMGLALVIGFFMSRALLFVLYFFAVAPMALLLKCMGKDLLSMKAGKDSGSYWKDHAGEFSKESYERQY